MLDTGFCRCSWKGTGEIFRGLPPCRFVLLTSFFPLRFFLISKMNTRLASIRWVCGFLTLWRAQNLMAELSIYSILIILEFLDYTPWREFLYVENEDGCRHGNTLLRPRLHSEMIIFQQTFHFLEECQRRSLDSGSDRDVQGQLGLARSVR